MFFKERVPEKVVDKMLELADLRADEDGPSGHLVPVIYGTRMDPELPMRTMMISMKAKNDGLAIGAVLLNNCDAVLVNPDALRAASRRMGREKIRTWKHLSRALEDEGYTILELKD